MGEDYQEGNAKKKRLRNNEIDKIVNTFLEKNEEKDFSRLVGYDEIKEKGYSLSAGQYFKFIIETVDISKEEYLEKIELHSKNLKMFSEKNNELMNNILEDIKGIKYE